MLLYDLAVGFMLSDNVLEILSSGVCLFHQYMLAHKGYNSLGKPHRFASTE